MSRRMVVVGATSAIAQAVTEQAVERYPGLELGLVSRSSSRLQAISEHFTVLGAGRTVTACLDVTRLREIEYTWNHLLSKMGGPPDIVLLAHGVLPDQQACQQDLGVMREAYQVNATSTLMFAEAAAGTLEEVGVGTLAVIGSVAGDRGRSSNYAYGAAKSSVHTFLSGLRGRLIGTDVHVVAVKPGLVATPMTSHLPSNALFASAERVGRDIWRAIERGAGTVYTPWYWRPIMMLLRLLPGPLFHRLPL